MKHRRYLAHVLALMVLLTGLAALGTALAEETEAVVVTASVEELVVAVGKKADYKLSIEPKAARRAGYDFSISDPSVATVDKRGAVKGVAEGACQLTIASKYDPSVTLVLPVTVVVPVKRISATLSADAVHVGETTPIAPP